MRLLILLSFLILVSCEEEITEFSHCTTFDENPQINFYSVYLFTLDNEGNQIVVHYNTYNNPFPGLASLELDDNLNYHLLLETNQIDENNDQSINFEESGLLDFVEGEPYSVMQPYGNSRREKKIQYQFHAEDGTSSLYRDRTVNCDQIIFDYGKRINDKDSILLYFLQE